MDFVSFSLAEIEQVERKGDVGKKFVCKIPAAMFVVILISWRILRGNK